VFGIEEYMSKKRVVITGVGPMCSLGKGNVEVWNSAINKRLNLTKESYSVGNEKWGEFYLHKIKDFNIDKFDLPQKNLRFIKEIRTIKKEDIDLYYFLAVIKLAIEDSRLEYDLNKNNIGLIISHENPGLEGFFEELIDSAYCEVAKNNKVSKLELAKALYNNGMEDKGYNLQTFSYLFSVAKVFDMHGPSLFINNACASGLFAIETAAKQIKDGVSPAVIVAAVDNPTKIYKYLWFKRYGLYAEDGITRPFSKHKSGIVFGDGGAALVLEDLEHAIKRRANIYGEYLGGGFSLEGWKITAPNISNDFYTQSFEKALSHSKVDSEDIDFINPHGVGMKVTDSYEAKTIRNIFKDKKPLLSAFKPLTGHNLGGSALLETTICLLALKHKIIPATLNCENPNQELGLNIVRDNTKFNIKVLAKMSCGFAGFMGVCLFRQFKK
jgi:3-oxoacyl-[acyl-carrier-protein] synthase II